MILIDALYINNSGGKILLDYLIDSLEFQNCEITYLLDYRIKGNHSIIKESNKVVYLEGNLKKRHGFYKSNKNRFTKVFCFGNLPPSIKLNATVYTYFHQKIFLEIPKQLPFKKKLVFKLKSIIFKLLKAKTNFWIVQTEVMKSGLQKSGIASNKILILPFYPSLVSNRAKVKVKNTFLYVSSGALHKNHLNLIIAFKEYYDEFKVGELHVTIGHEFSELLNLILNLIVMGYPIINHGTVSREKLAKLYNFSTFVIYPSLSESFGLGLLEGLENNCKIVGSNLPYTFAVCHPSLVFDPNDIASIKKSFAIAVNENIEDSEQLVFNEIDKIIQLLK